MKSPATMYSLVVAALLVSGCPGRVGPQVGREIEPINALTQRGQHVYMRHCHQCHPNGTTGMGPSLVWAPIPSAVIRTQVRVGFGAMPAYPKERISDVDLDALVAYIHLMEEQVKDSP